jgi:hypothetical protein
MGSDNAELSMTYGWILRGWLNNDINWLTLVKICINGSLDYDDYDDDDVCLADAAGIRGQCRPYRA